MIWDGSTVLVLWGYRPITEIAIKWHQRADTNWRGCDRGSDEDVYSSNVIFRGPISELSTLETILDNNRTNFNATFNAGEQIFGADVDHTSTISVIVTEYGKIRQSSFKMFEMALTLRHANPTFITTTPDFTKLRLSTHQNTRVTEFELNKLFTYDDQAFVVDRLSNDGNESGTFTGRFAQTVDEMPAIRRYLAVTARANKIVFPTFGGITKPFGTRSGTGPFNCRIVNWSDLGRRYFCDWGLLITFSRDLDYWNE